MFLNLTCLVLKENDTIPQPCRINTDFIISAHRDTYESEGIVQEITYILTLQGEYMVIEKYQEISDLLDDIDKHKAKTQQTYRVF